MTKKIHLIFIVLGLLMTVIFGWTFFTHLSMPFNKEGRYFDEQHLIVYKETSIMVYGLIATTGLCITTFLIVIWFRKKIFSTLGQKT
jgi:hypothetical protein